MASTRNLNTKYDYLCEKKHNEGVLNYMTDTNYGQHDKPVFLDLGSNPSSMYASNMSHNNIDIESKLRGIRSVNLEGSSFNPTMNQKSVSCGQIFERNKIYVPSPFKHEMYERPLYLN